MRFDKNLEMVSDEDEAAANPNNQKSPAETNNQQMQRMLDMVVKEKSKQFLESIYL